MTEQPQHYTLQLLFDSSQIALETLQERIAGALGDTIPNIELRIAPTKFGHLLVVLQGPLEVVDICHDKINKLTTASPPMTFIRLIDEAGDAVRQQAYPIIARIEQDLRSFIHCAIIGVFPFGWWEAVISGRLHARTQDVANKNKAAAPYLHRLELTQFEDLIDLITYEKADWPEDKPLSASDLLDLLAGCTSITEAHTKLAEKTKKVSLWDRVFVRYFTDIRQWEAVKKSIDFVIRERHKVMHYRPICLGVVEALRIKQQEIQSLLEATKDVLSEQERAEIQQEVGEQLPKQVGQVRWQQEMFEMVRHVTQSDKDTLAALGAAAFAKDDMRAILRGAGGELAAAALYASRLDTDALAALAAAAFAKDDMRAIVRGAGGELAAAAKDNMQAIVRGAGETVLRAIRSDTSQPRIEQAKQDADAAAPVPTEPEQTAQKPQADSEEAEPPTEPPPATGSDPKLDPDE